MKHIKCSLDNYYLVRHFDLKAADEVYKDDNDKILAEYLYHPEERLQDLSTSLFGHFKEEHLKISWTKEGLNAGYGHYCDPDQSVDIPKSGSDFTENHLRRGWYIKISNILSINKASVERSGKNVPILPFVIHTSTKGNFWHFSVRWIVDGKDMYSEDLTTFTKTQKTKVAQRIGHTCKVLMMHFAKDIKPETGLLPDDEYKKAV